MLRILKSEKGLLDTYMLAVYLVFSMTLFAFILGIGSGMFKQAQAKYQWFGGAMEFSVRASNLTGDIDFEEVKLNEDLAKSYFQSAMRANLEDYELEYFKSVDIGDEVPSGTAGSPGYMAAVTVPVYNAEVPLIGRQKVEIPMRYFAVVKSTSEN